MRRILEVVSRLRGARRDSLEAVSEWLEDVKRILEDVLEGLADG
jgi:hypothetical protein